MTVVQKERSGSLEGSFQEITLKDHVDSGKIMLETLEDEQEQVDLSKSSVASEVSTTAPSDNLVDYTGSKDLLLRLFQSDYFDSWIGLNYLWRYNSKDVGIQYFLCERLKDRPIGEIEFVLPQIWYYQVNDFFVF